VSSASNAAPCSRLRRWITVTRFLRVLDADLRQLTEALDQAQTQNPPSQAP
jgi:hypothetical protein